jgi:diguanylate cyclase (GGDEF)-like protein
MQIFSKALRIWHRYLACCVLFMFIALSGLANPTLAVAQNQTPATGSETSGADDSKGNHQLNTPLNGQSPNPVQDSSTSDQKSKYDALIREKQQELQQQKDYAFVLEQSNDQLRQTIYILSMIVAIALVLFSYLVYRKVHATNRLLIEANMKLQIQSMRDPLTGLLTRHAFHDSMRARMKVTDRRQTDINQPPHALALLDIDHFKLINDKFGHGVGDQVLIEVSNRLMQIMRENDKLMRWTGEEFLLFLNNITTENLERVIQRVLSVVGSTAIYVDNKPLNVTVSVGYISLAHGKESDVDEHWEKALKLADAALYKAKINGRNQAVGIPNNTIVLQDLDAVLTINLDDLTEQEKIVVSKITGPLQRGKIGDRVTV